LKIGIKDHQGNAEEGGKKRKGECITLGGGGWGLIPFLGDKKRTARTNLQEGGGGRKGGGAVEKPKKKRTHSEEKKGKKKRTNRTYRFSSKLKKKKEKKEKGFKKIGKGLYPTRKDSVKGEK